MRALALLLVVIALVPCTALLTRPAHAAAGPQPVYLVLADSVQGSIDAATKALQRAAVARGWQVVATHDVPGDRAACSYRARVLVLNDAEYAARVLEHGPLAAFALPPRLLLFEDEEGLHLSTVNPMNINRTIIAESGFEDASQALLRDLTVLARGALQARFVTRGYGQVRERGLVGRTMGIMAGGPFTEKVHELYAVPGNGAADVRKVADDVWAKLEHGGKGRWQVHGIYKLDLSAKGVVVVGAAGDAMETKSYAIVGAGADAHRSKFKCPGVAHAAAYPIEIVVYADQGRVHVATVEGMYRMKVYFEDAGKMKFAANMGMPGAIEDEVRAVVGAGK